MPADTAPTPGRTSGGRLRDHTGRPLPVGTPEPPGGFALEHDVKTVEEALALAVQRWDLGRYFEAHELLEHVWHHAPDDERDFWQGVIQVAVAHVMGQRERWVGVGRTADKARARLAGVGAVAHGIDVAALRRQLDVAEQVAARGGPALEPEFPVVDEDGPWGQGPWFSRDTAHTPLTREPAWLVASQQKAARARAAEQTPRARGEHPVEDEG